MSMAQVEKILGKPDDVLKPNESWETSETNLTFWCYGSDKHLAPPMLGEVEFTDEKVLDSTWGNDKDYRQLVPERELRGYLRKMVRRYDVFLEYDPLWTVRTANMLLPLGKEKALFVIEQFVYVCCGPGELQPAEQVFWLLRAMFVPEQPFPLPAIGMITPGVPKDRSDVPLFPMIVWNDIPINLITMLLLAGAPESPLKHVEYFREHGLMRTNLLKPPDDPFESYQKLIESDLWTKPRLDRQGEAVRFEPDIVLREVLLLVRGAYRPHEMESSISYIWKKDLDKYHRGFLATQAHWDEKRQQYIAGNGRLLKDPDLAYHPPRVWTPTPIGNVKFKVTISRFDLWSTRSYIDVDAGQSEEIDPALMRIVDAKTGEELGVLAVPGHRNDGSLYEKGGEAKFLALPPQKVRKDEGLFGTEYYGKPGRLVYFEIVTAHATRRSPVFRI